MLSLENFEVLRLIFKYKSQSLSIRKCFTIPELIPLKHFMFKHDMRRMLQMEIN